MPARNPDFAMQAEAAYKAADRAIKHLEECGPCMFTICSQGRRLLSIYRSKKKAALKAFRGKKTKRPQVSSDNDRVTRRLV